MSNCWFSLYARLLNGVTLKIIKKKKNNHTTDEK